MDLLRLGHFFPLVIIKGSEVGSKEMYYKFMYIT